MHTSACYPLLNKIWDDMLHFMQPLMCHHMGIYEVLLCYLDLSLEVHSFPSWYILLAKSCLFFAP